MNKFSDFRFQISNSVLIKTVWSAVAITIVVLITSSCNSGSTGGDSSNSVKFKQYYIQGQQLYLQHCSNCHQEDGSGLGRVYPPLNTSDYMENYFEDVICIIRYGKSGEIIVNGESYVQRMPDIPSLTDLEIAEIATYIYNTWDHNRGIIEVKEVSSLLRSCRDSTDTSI